MSVLTPLICTLCYPHEVPVFSLTSLHVLVGNSGSSLCSEEEPKSQVIPRALPDCKEARQGAVPLGDVSQNPPKSGFGSELNIGGKKVLFFILSPRSSAPD